MVSCAQEKEESANDIQKQILDAYISVYYPNAEQMPSGLTYIDRKIGTGDTLEKYNGAYVQFTTKTLEGNYTSTNNAELAKVLGTYSKSTYYGPRFYEIGYGSTYIGIEEMLIGMRAGGEATAIVPPWLTSTEYSTASQAASTNMIYTFTLKKVIKDIMKFQLDSMASYAHLHYPGLDTTSKGYYFKNLVTGGKDTIESTASVKVRYIGRLLDGFIFDTNIADTAKKYGIYNASNEYAPLDVTYAEDINVMSENNSGLRLGFCKALLEMDYEDHAFTMFYSELGYGSQGSGESIGPFQPLIFYIYIEPKAKTE